MILTQFVAFNSVMFVPSGIRPSAVCHESAANAANVPRPHSRQTQTQIDLLTIVSKTQLHDPFLNLLRPARKITQPPADFLQPRQRQ